MTAIQFQNDLRQLEIYSEDTEAWKIDYEAAERCFEIEKKLSCGIFLFGYLFWLENACREGLRTRKVKFDPEVPAAITKLFWLWQKPCEKLLGAMASLEHEGYVVNGADKFRECCREVADMLEQRSWADRASQSRRHLAHQDD